jgi:hypothetical protein
MKALRSFIIALMAALACTSTQAAEHPKFGPEATRLHDSHEYVRAHAAPDFWALMPYYLPQQDGRSCSVATVAMITNAERAGRKLTASDELVTQKGLLKKVGDSKWIADVGQGGHGVTLDELGRFMTESAATYGFPRARAEVMHVESASPEWIAKVRAVLERNEKSAQDFVAANFLQSVYTGDPEGAVGHIAPVGAYDAKNERVLILDPDREYYEPYWVSLKIFVKGLATKDSESGKTRGLVVLKTGE